MGTKGCCTEHFSSANFSPTHHEPILFVVSHWQYDKSRPGFIYLIYRAAVAAFLLSTWGWSFGPPSWAIYLTNWGYTMVALQALMAFILSCATVLSKVFNANNVHDIFLKLYPLYWIAHQAALPIAFMITIIYWTLLFVDMPFTALDFFVHGSNSIILFVDLLIIGHPIRILHFIYPFIFGIIYGLFSVAYFFYDTHRGGTGIIYFILDWNTPFQTILIVFGIIVLVLALHIFTFCIHMLKEILHVKLYPASVKRITKNTQSTEQLAV